MIKNRFTDFYRGIILWLLDRHTRALDYMVFFKCTNCRKYFFYLVSMENMPLFSKHHCCVKCRDVWEKINNKESPPDSKPAQA